MSEKCFTYPITIQETYLDTFGHVNNATYMTLFEEARWAFINKNGYGLKKIQETGIGPTVLSINVRFIKELCVRDQITITSEMTAYDKKIGTLMQQMWREDELCCSAEFTIALFSLKERKLIEPTQEWLHAVGFKPDKK